MWKKGTIGREYIREATTITFLMAKKSFERNLVPIPSFEGGWYSLELEVLWFFFKKLTKIYVCRRLAQNCEIVEN